MKKIIINQAKIKKRLERKPILRKLDVYREVLVVADEDKSQLESFINAIFPRAKIYFLFPRNEKEDQTKTDVFSYHISDLNLTGKVKNDKLKKVLDNRFDLVVDLSKNLPLNNFILARLNHTFMVGSASNNKSLWYDLIIPEAKNDKELFEHIKTQINLLSQNGAK
ncbi:DUF6913 domain-containing protein [Crocinitomix algicola]|uniref:DUF6913 domain-containing protein n=1 Tax=Crocinitomix algicola TaxID=1740263 RepID=UPI0008726487|nr:hypothetical protein [Crocinitomix algicola]